MKTHTAWGRWGVLAAGLLLVTPGPGHGQPFSSGSTGANGAFSPTGNTTLALPPGGVFNFTTINIPPGVILTFTRNATNTPVTLLATGDVTIAGDILLNGQDGGIGSVGTATGTNGGLPGSGGGAGGSGSSGVLDARGGAGLGPGGGSPGTPAGRQCSGGGGGHNGAGGDGTGGQLSTCSVAGGPAYGGARLLPLLGGSGGGGGSASFGGTAAGGAGGGGAILIASSTRITLTSSGSIRANGGNGSGPGFARPEGGGGGGSGGAIRLVAPILEGSAGNVQGSLQVAGGTGGGGDCGFTGCPAVGGAGAPGRIRLEASTFNLTAVMTVVPSQGPLGTVTLASPPTLRFTSVAGVTPPASPQGSYGTPDVTLPAGFTNPVTIAVEGTQIPPGSAVSIRSIPLQGGGASTVGTLAGSLGTSTASVVLNLPTNQPTVLAAEATFAILTAANFDGPTRFAGEPITHIRVAAVFGGPSAVTYITASGKEVSAERLRAEGTGQ